LGTREEHLPGRPAVGANILLNGLEFEIIGVLDKIGREGNNGSNARIFVRLRQCVCFSSEG